MAMLRKDRETYHQAPREKGADLIECLESQRLPKMKSVTKRKHVSLPSLAEVSLVLVTCDLWP